MFGAAKGSAIWHYLPALGDSTSFSPLPTVGLKTLIIGKVKILHLCGKQVRHFFPAPFKSWDFPSLAFKWILKEILAKPCLGDSRHTHTLSRDAGWGKQQAVLFWQQTFWNLLFKKENLSWSFSSDKQTRRRRSHSWSWLSTGINCGARGGPIPKLLYSAPPDSWFRGLLEQSGGLGFSHPRGAATEDSVEDEGRQLLSQTFRDSTPGQEVILSFTFQRLPAVSQQGPDDFKTTYLAI